jgi:outer membrane receptor protein involved in Fe transport
MSIHHPKIMACGSVIAACLASSPARAHDPDAPPVEPKAPPASPVEPTPPAPLEVTVQGDKPNGDTASRVDVGRRELELRPRLRPGDIVEAVPGLFAVQHAGGGKSSQYLMRGFDADHGTDVAFYTDGVPVNMPSHGHGQGYSDLHFVIPELVVGLEGYKGMSFTQFGDFATAGAINMRFAEKYEESYAQYSIGQLGIMRGLVVESPDLGDTWRAVVAAELYKDEGPFINPEGLRRYNVYAKVTHDLSASSKVQMSWMSYGSTWNGSGQIPARAVCGEGDKPNSPWSNNPDQVNKPPEYYGQKCIDRFGYIDPSEGGSTQRHQGVLAFSTRVGDDSELSVNAFLTRYRFTLWSNFTFFEQHPLQGDEVEQDDDRWILGGSATYHHHFKVGPAKITATAGLQVREDIIENGLYHDQMRARLDPVALNSISVSNIGLFAEADMRLLPQLRLVAGIRGDRIDVNVDDKLGAGDPQGGDNSGAKGAMRASPKLQAIVSPVKYLDVFLDYGRGFHSNDARGVVQHVNPATLMTGATSYEAGLRVKPIKDLFVQADAYLIDLDSELVWNGDTGGTSAAGATRRYGIEASARYHFGNVVYVDADFTVNHARYTQTVDLDGVRTTRCPSNPYPTCGNYVALAPVRTFSFGVGARPTFGDFTPSAEVRVRSISDRPADPLDMYTDQGWTIVNAQAGLRWKRIEASVDVQNLFNVAWREVSYTQDGRLPYEPKTVIGTTYTPGWPRTVIGSAKLYW